MNMALINTYAHTHTQKNPQEVPLPHSHNAQTLFLTAKQEGNQIKYHPVII